MQESCSRYSTVLVQYKGTETLTLTCLLSIREGLVQPTNANVGLSV
jgi:hypothetical protein